MREYLLVKLFIYILSKGGMGKKVIIASVAEFLRSSFAFDMASNRRRR